jgi:hypothetical protein
MHRLRRAGPGGRWLIVPDAPGHKLPQTPTSRSVAAADECAIDDNGRTGAMLLMRDADIWLDHADPWSECEARELLEAVREAAPVGRFDCVAGAVDGHWLLLAEHAEVGLLLDAPGRARFVELLILRFGLDEGGRATAWWASREPLADHPPAANESRPAPLWDAPPPRYG